MPAFTLDPGGSVPGGGWRPLRKKGPMQRGWDVYDLQCKLNYANGGAGIKVIRDGVFGAATNLAVKSFQTSVAPQAGIIDGIAGVKTQVILAQYCCGRTDLPNRVFGQMQKETSMLCGIYTGKYENGSQDTGPLQMNTQYHQDLNQNFDVGFAVQVLVAQINEYHTKYVGWNVPVDRAWAAAQGSWNNHVYADRYARGQSVPQSFLDYVEAVTAYAWGVKT